MLSIMRRIFGRATPMTEGSNPRLKPAHDRHACATAVFAALERQRQVAVSKAPTDYAAARELEALMPKLAEADAEVRAAAHELAVEAEVQAVINQLVPTVVTLRGILERTSEEFCERADTPDDQTEWVPFVLRDRELERLRLTIVQAVGPAEAERLDLSRGFSYVAAVQQHWAAVHRDRERLAVLHGPGHKLKLGQPSWFALADKLARLRAGTARKEAQYAVR